MDVVATIAARFTVETSCVRFLCRGVVWDFRKEHQRGERGGHEQQDSNKR